MKLQKKQSNSCVTTNSNIGHRKRLKDRFLKGGTKAVSDYELLEMILFMANARVDQKPLAKSLLKTFGSLGDVLNASMDQLLEIKEVSSSVAIAIKIVEASSNKLLQHNVYKSENIFSSFEYLLDYAKSSIGYLKEEQFRILFLNDSNALIYELIEKGTNDYVNIYPKRILQKCLNLNASSIILIHNHTENTVEPSENDIILTNSLKKTLEVLEISVLDHVIVYKNKYFSFKKSKIL